MITDLLEGITTELETSIATEAVNIRTYTTYRGSGNVPTGAVPPYMNWYQATSDPTQYVMQTGNAKKYKGVEVTFSIVTYSKKLINIGKCAKDLQNLFERSNFALTNGRVIDSTVTSDFSVPNTDSDGYTWFVGFMFEIGT